MVGLHDEGQWREGFVQFKDRKNRQHYIRWFVLTSDKRDKSNYRKSRIEQLVLTNNDEVMFKWANGKATGKALWPFHKWERMLLELIVMNYG